MGYVGCREPVGRGSPDGPSCGSTALSARTLGPVPPVSSRPAPVPPSVPDTQADTSIDSFPLWTPFSQILRCSPNRGNSTQLKSRIERIHSWSRGTYGAPRIRAELADEGQRVSRKRVARLMKEVGVEGVSRRRRTRTTHRKPGGSCRAPDLVDRNFTAHRPDQLWVADITYIGTWTGFLYSCTDDAPPRPPTPPPADTAAFLVRSVLCWSQV